jgi:hypothetical protein
MRKTPLLLTAALGLCMLFGCNQKNPATTDQVAAARQDYIPVEPSQIKDPKQLVPLDTANLWAKTYWDAMVKLYGADSAKIVKGFTFRTSDLLAPLGVKSTPNTPHIQGRFGINPHTNEAKLFFVGILDANLDIEPRQAGRIVYFRKATNGQLTDGGDNVLDLNYPCPTLCPGGDGMGMKQQ